MTLTGERKEISFEPTILEAASRYRVLVISITVAAALLAALFSITRPVRYAASGAMVVEDPALGSLLDTGTASRADRYLLDQIQIMQTATVASEALEILAQNGEAPSVSGLDIQENLSVAGTAVSDLITITYSGESPTEAMQVSDAIAQAYQQVVSSEETRSAESAIEELDRAIESIDTSIQELEDEIAGVRSGAVYREDLEAQLEDSIAEIVELQEELARGPSDQRADAIRTRLLDLQTQISTIRSLREVDAADPEAAALREERQALISRRSLLITSRNDLRIESQLASTGVAFYSPPIAAVRVGSLGLPRMIVIGVLGGLALGVSIAYLLAGRRRVFTDRDTPELVTNAPLLADVPHFSEESLKGSLPALEAPRSVVAEAYRFAASSLEVTGGGSRTLVAVSPLNGGGKTTTVANLGIAMAREGQNVLVIDADFGNQELTRLLRVASGEEDGTQIPEGITEVVSNATPLAAALQKLTFRGDLELTLLSRGARPVLAVEFFRSPLTRYFFEQIGEKFDLVLIDTPPLLQVAYSGTVASLADGAIAIVDHRSPVRQVEDMMSRLEFVGAKVAGYVYNRAPLRREMTVVDGSMRDIMGDQGWVAE